MSRYTASEAAALMAAGKLTPAEIQATFFDGAEFTAATPSGVRFKMTFTADGKALRKPAGGGGAKGEGIWKLDDIRVQWSKLRSGIRELTDKIAVAEQERNKVVGEQAAIEEQFQAKNNLLEVRLEELMFRLRVVDADLAKAISETKRGPEKYGQLDVARDRLLKDRPDLKEEFDLLDAAYREYGEARTKRASAA